MLSWSGRIDPHTDNSGLTQKMKDSGCPSDFVRTTWGLDKEIVQAKEVLKVLNLKQDRITQLKSQIIAYPDRAAQAIQDYEKHGADELDVGLSANYWSQSPA